MPGVLGQHYADKVTGVVDHHDDDHKVPKDATPRVIEKSGSCCSLVVSYCRDDWDEIASASSSTGATNAQDQGIVDDAAYTSAWDAQLAKLALVPILIDTFNLKDEHKVTDHDKKAIKYLEARINASPKIGKDFERDTLFHEINEAKSDLDGLSLDDILRKDYKQWSEGDLTLGISSVVKPVDYLMAKPSDFVPTLSAFAQKRGLDLLAITTAYTAKSGDFARQLMLMATADGKASEIAHNFVSSSSAELQLDDAELEASQESEVPYLRFWDQKNVAASRKRIAPLLREAMR